MAHFKNLMLISLLLLLFSCAKEESSPIQADGPDIEIELIGFESNQLIFKKYDWYDFAFRVRDISGGLVDVSFLVLNGKARINSVEPDGTYLAEFKPFSPGEHEIEIMAANEFETVSSKLFVEVISVER